ncbi:4'-phosphopantetheinyl transferase family protein [Rathayibacter tritici]|uniref:4'-phosphopantetheinyl transferase family protein n=1 Tax=Rathayibacter tritici TaxID=33888 RepID=UPI00142F3B27|nr:hypothetical protein [Rathayibacter tritici]
MTAVARLRELVAREHGERAAADTITRTCDGCGAAHGRPRFAHVPVDFSLSHSADRVAIALTPHGTVGIDIEALLPRRPLRLLPGTAVASEDTLTGLYRRWTQREALLKTGRNHTDARILRTFTIENRYLVSVAHSRTTQLHHPHDRRMTP